MAVTRLATRIVKPRWLLPLYSVIALALIATIILVVMHVLHTRALPGKIAQHLATGDGYRAELWYERALKEYEAALRLDPQNIETRRRIIGTQVANLTLRGFGPGAPVDPALQAEYYRIELVPPAEIDATLARLQELYRAAPELGNDPALLWDEAMLLKVGGQPERARAVLQRLHRMQPNDVAVGAELGLLTTILNARREIDGPGLSLLEAAVAAQPHEPRYHFYLARALQESFGCTAAATPKRVSYVERRTTCGRARREYEQAESLAQGDDIWMRRIHLRANKDAHQPALH